MSFDGCCGARISAGPPVVTTGLPVTAAVQKELIDKSFASSDDLEQRSSDDDELHDREARHSWMGLALVERLQRRLSDGPTWIDGCKTALVVVAVGFLTALPAGAVLVAAEFLFWGRIPDGTSCSSLDASTRTELFVTSMFTYHLPVYLTVAFSVFLALVEIGRGRGKWNQSVPNVVLATASVMVFIFIKGLLLIHFIDGGGLQGTVFSYANVTVFFVFLGFMCTFICIKLREVDPGIDGTWFAICFGFKIISEFTLVVAISFLGLLRLSWFPYYAGFIFYATALLSRWCASESGLPVQSQYLISASSEVLAAVSTRMASTVVLQHTYELLRLEVFLLFSNFISRTSMILRDEISDRAFSSLRKCCCCCNQQKLRKQAGASDVNAHKSQQHNVFRGTTGIDCLSLRTASSIEEQEASIRYAHIYLMEMVFDVAATVLFYGVHAMQLVDRTSVQEQTQIWLYILACILIQGVGCVMLCLFATVPKIQTSLWDLSQEFYTFSVVGALSLWLAFNTSEYQGHLKWALEMGNATAPTCLDPSLSA